MQRITAFEFSFLSIIAGELKYKKGKWYKCKAARGLGLDSEISNLPRIFYCAQGLKHHAR